MKTAKEIRVGNVIKIHDTAYRVLKLDIQTTSCRTDNTIKFKLKDINSGTVIENSFKSDKKLETIIMDEFDAIYSYHIGDNLVFIDSDCNQYEILKSNIEPQVLRYLEEGSEVIMMMLKESVIGLSFNNTISRNIAYTEDICRGDTSGKLYKDAKLSTGFTISVPAYCNEGDLIEIDTKDHKFLKRIID